MGSIAIGLIILGCIFGSAVLGMLLRVVVPEKGLTSESKDLVLLVTGLIGTMAALVLGLLIGTSKSSYDKQDDAVTELSANVILLDRMLLHYGPAAAEARTHLRRTVTGAMARIWPEDAAAAARLGPLAAEGESLYDAIFQLAPENDRQRKLQEDAEGICTELARQRLLLFQQTRRSASPTLLVIMVFWLSAIFVSFGLFAPRTVTVLLTLFVCALSVAGAIFLMLEWDQPFNGLLRISDAPVRAALAQLGA